jgi:phage gp36-like protein
MYTSVGAVQAVLARSISQYDSTAASLSTDQLTAAINSAGSEIDARLAHQYKVPFRPLPDTPPLIVEIARDIAAFLADLTFRQDVDYTSENEPILLRHRRAQSLLDMLAGGTISLTGAEPTEPVARPLEPYTAVNPYHGDLFTLRDFDLGYETSRYPQYPTRMDW